MKKVYLSEDLIMRHQWFYFNNVDYSYTSETRFIVQVGRGHRKYKTKYIIVGEPLVAIQAYQGINLNSPYKKRLFIAGQTRHSKTILARTIT